MSLKDAFKKKTSILQNAATSSAGIESSDYLITKIQVEDRFEPHINFASSSAFAHFGSAEIYYDSAIKRIHNEYPYDGTKREKLLFDLSSSYLDKWVFDNKYPKTTGYINFSHGGWGTADSITNGYGLPPIPQIMNISLLKAVSIPELGFLIVNLQQFFKIHL